MNLYAFLTCAILALFLYYLDVEWLGLLFILLAILFLLYNPTKSTAKKVWEEAKTAQGTSPEAKFGEYINITAKKAAEEFSPSQPFTVYNTKDLSTKMHSVSKNFFSELKGLFK